MCTRILLVVLGLSMCAQAGTLTPAGQHLAPAQSEVVRGMNESRLAEGLSAVTADTVMSCLIQYAFRDLEDPLDTASEEDAWAGRCFAGIPYWDRACFTARADSRAELLEELLVAEGFEEAMLRPDATHVVVAIGERAAGGVLCFVCVMRRLVELGPSRVQVVLEGPTSLTLWGKSECREMRARFYKSEAEPDDYCGEEFWVDFEASETGDFEIFLPISKFGAGTYRAFIYVRETGHEEYTVAAHAGMHVQDH